MNNKNGSFGINKYCENFLVELLNLVYNLRLINLNEIMVNFPSIDLGDKESRVCYQVTSTSEISKIEYTVDKFLEKDLYKEYGELNIFILGDKNNHRKPIKRDEVEFLYERSLFDFNSLSVDILNIKNHKKISDIWILLENSLRMYKASKNDYTMNQEHMLNNILFLLNDETKDNIIKLYSIKNCYNRIEFRIKEIVELITDDQFIPNKFYQPFPVLMKTNNYDRYEYKLMKLPSEEVKWIFDI